MERTEQLIREYEQITAQIIHWDTLSWQTSQFFLAVEGLFLGGIGHLLYSEFKETGPSPFVVVSPILCATVFNIVLCCMWFRINRRNREYLDIRFKRAGEIESEPDIVMCLYTRESNELTQPKYKGHSTRNLEKHIPTMFAIAWAITGVGGTIAALLQ